MIPLSTVPIEVRKEYALSLLKLGVLEPLEALTVTVAPGDTLVDFADEHQIPKLGQPRERNCSFCGRLCWSRGKVARCRSCFEKTRRSTRGYCSRGHAWTDENVYTRPNGHQYCRECMNESKRAHRARYGRRDRQAA